MARLSEVGEDGFVDAVSRLLAGGWRCGSLGPGDDAACCGDGLGDVLLKIDGYSLASSRLPWMSMYDVGWKAAVAAMSDVNAKACRPVCLAISLGLPGSTELGEAVSIVRGARDAAVDHGAWLCGGDVNEAGEAWIDVAVVGKCTVKPLAVSGAGPGDEVYVTTLNLGYTGAALQAFYKGWWRRAPAWLLERAARPRLPSLFPRLAESLGCLTAATDVSDGLAYSLWRLSRSSGHRLVVEELPEPRGLPGGVDPVEAVLYGGEEYDVVFTARRGCGVLEEARRLGLPVQRIGVIVDAPPGVYWSSGRRIDSRGWRHFSGRV